MLNVIPRPEVFSGTSKKQTDLQDLKKTFKTVFCASVGLRIE